MLDYDYLKARKLLLPQVEEISITLVGCGGTGSWLAPAVVRVGKHLIEEQDREVKINFIDPDMVEKKNIYRQNFCEAEIGLNKAASLAQRYGLAWGVPISVFPEAFNSRQLNGWGSSLSIIIGCVDNASARKAIADSITSYRNRFWLDCGNEHSSGQVLLGCGNKKMPEDNFRLPDFCSWLPSPAVQHPDLLESRQSDEQVSLSCAEIMLQDSQGMAINQRMAAEAADYLVRMLITRDLKKFATYIDLESGVCKSKYITPENLGVSMETEGE